MTQYLANISIDEGAAFLAKRQVGLRHSLVTPLVKTAEKSPISTYIQDKIRGGSSAGVTPPAPTVPETPAPAAPAAPEAPATSTPKAPAAPPKSKGMWAGWDPDTAAAMQTAMWGTGIGGGLGLLTGLRRDKKRRNLLRDTLTGALAGGALGGGYGMAKKVYEG